MNREDTETIQAINTIPQNNPKTKQKEEKKKSCIFKIFLSFILIFIIFISSIFMFYFIKVYISNSNLDSNNKNNQYEKIQNMNINPLLNQLNYSSTESINAKSNYIVKIRHYQNETLVYKKIKNITTIMEIDNENSTKELITTSYILFHINDVIYKELEQSIFIANILILNSTVKENDFIYPVGGINILEGFENQKNNLENEKNENEDNNEF